MLNNYLNEHTCLKFNIELYENYDIPTHEDKQDMKSFNTKMVEICFDANLKEILENLFNIIKVKMEEFEEHDSGWSITNILFFWNLI